VNKNNGSAAKNMNKLESTPVGFKIKPPTPSNRSIAPISEAPKSMHSGNFTEEA
jgi:hypothetical protein